MLPPGSGGDPALAQGLLGADVERAEDRTWRIARILPGESSVIGARSRWLRRASPRRRAISSLRWTGGRWTRTSARTRCWPAAGKPVELTLRRDGADRRAVVVPLASEHAARYYDLVARQRAAVCEASGGATVVGTRTWGGVLGVDLKYELVDGTMMAQPKYAWWFAGVGWAVENHGVDPDVEVTIAPHDWAAGRDPHRHRRPAGVAGTGGAHACRSAHRLTRRLRDHSPQASGAPAPMPPVGRLAPRADVSHPR